MTNKEIDKNGYAMFIVMMVIMVLFLLGTAILSVAGNSKKDSICQREQMQAYFIAEAGVEKTLAKVVSDWEWLSSNIPKPYLQNLPFAGGNIVYSNIGKETISGGYMVTIESKGHFGNSNRTLVVSAKIIKQQPENGDDCEITIVSWKEKYGVF